MQPTFTYQKKGISVSQLVIAGAGAGIIAVLSMVMTLTTSIVPGASYLWLPAAFQLAFSIWFGVWGMLASALGTFLGGLWGGSPFFYNILINPVPAFFANSLLPWLLFRAFKVDPAMGRKKDWVLGFVIVVVASVSSAAIGAWGTVFAGMGTSQLAWGVIFPGWTSGDIIAYTLLGLPLLKALTGFVKRSGLYVENFFS